MLNFKGQQRKFIGEIFSKLKHRNIVYGLIKISILLASFNYAFGVWLSLRLSILNLFGIE